MRAARPLAALLALALACAHAPPRERAPGSPWYHGAVVYGVVPPLFAAGGEPPLRAVAARLDALRDLGVDALWLAPVMDTDDRGAISYATKDYRRVRPDYGTMEDLRALVREAHARGIRVLLDVVPNHTSVGHPWYRDAEARGRSSPYWSWYVRDASGQATWDFDWKHLRRLDYGNPAVRREMTATFVWWVREAGVDGFRVDAAWGIRDRSPDYWPELVAALRRERPGIFLLAEASARDPYWVTHGFDAAYDWTPQLGRWAWEGLFDDPAATAAGVAADLEERATPPDRVFRFLDNNDTGPRFLTRHGLETARVATVLLHALPGIASIFTGDEACAAYQPYEDPPPVDWSRPCDLRGLHARLAALRERIPALRDGGYRRLDSDSPGALAFLRDAGAAGRAVAVLNFGAAATVRVALPAGGGPVPTWDAVTGAAGRVRAVPGGLEVELGARTGVILVPPPS